MKGYDVIEALGQVEDEYVEEAEQKRNLKGGRYRANRDAGRKEKNAWVLKAAAVCALLLVLPAATVLAVDYFSTLKGDELAFGRVEYRGDGIVAIQVQNNSDKVLEFQEDVKLGIFYANKEIPRIEGGNVKMEGNVIASHSSSELIVDLSGAYDMEIADQPLTNDWYYLVLTNNHFVFGQDWQCMIDFQDVTEEGVVYRAENEEESGEYHEESPGEYKEITMDSFVYADWAKPVENMSISAFYGARESGGLFSDHINIAGSKGDTVFAVAGGTVAEMGYEASSGNYVVLSVQDGVKVKYGHLQDVYVSEDQAVEKGAIIGTVGQTGLAVGPTLLLALYVNDKPVNPLREESGTAPEAPDMYLAADLLEERLAAPEADSVSSGLNVPVFIAYNGAVYGGYDYDISGDYIMASDIVVEFNPSYTYTAYQVIGRPDLVAIIINGGYMVYQKAFDVAFALDGVTYQVECPSSYLGEGDVGEQIGEKNDIKIYRAIGKEDQGVIEGKCIVDISELMSQAFPEYFSDPEGDYADCWWVADAVE